MSEHLKVLLDTGLVTETRHGRRRHDSVTPEPLRDLAQWPTPDERFRRTKLAGLSAFLVDKEPG